MKKRSLRWYMRLSWGFVAAGLVVLLITAVCTQGGIFMRGDSDLMQTVLLVVSLALIVAGLGVQIKFLRCPACGESLYSRWRWIDYCPHCGAKVDWDAAE